MMLEQNTTGKTGKQSFSNDDMSDNLLQRRKSMGDLLQIHSVKDDPEGKVASKSLQMPSKDVDAASSSSSISGMTSLSPFPSGQPSKKDVLMTPSSITFPSLFDTPPSSSTSSPSDMKAPSQDIFAQDFLSMGSSNMTQKQEPALMSAEKNSTTRKRFLSTTSPLRLNTESATRHEDSLHQIELLHFVSMEVKQRKDKQVSMADLIKVLHFLYPSLILFLSCQPLPLTLEMKTNGRKAAKIEVQLGHVLSSTSLFEVTPQFVVRFLVRNDPETVKELEAELRSGLRSALCFMIEGLLSKLSTGSLSISDIHEYIRGHFEYTESHFVRTTGALRALLCEEGFVIQEDVVFARTSVDEKTQDKKRVKNLDPSECITIYSPSSICTPFSNKECNLKAKGLRKPSPQPTSSTVNVAKVVSQRPFSPAKDSAEDHPWFQPLGCDAKDKPLKRTVSFSSNDALCPIRMDVTKVAPPAPQISKCIFSVTQTHAIRQEGSSSPKLSFAQAFKEMKKDDCVEEKAKLQETDINGPHGRRCICDCYSKEDLVSKAILEDEESFTSFALVHIDCIISTFVSLSKDMNKQRTCVASQTDIHIDPQAVIE